MTHTPDKCFVISNMFAQNAGGWMYVIYGEMHCLIDWQLQQNCAYRFLIICNVYVCQPSFVQMNQNVQNFIGPLRNKSNKN